MIDVLVSDEQSLHMAGGDQFRDPCRREPLTHVVAVPARVDQQPTARAVEAFDLQKAATAAGVVLAPRNSPLA